MKGTKGWGGEGHLQIIMCFILCLKTQGKNCKYREFYFYPSMARFNEYVKATDFPF